MKICFKDSVVCPFYLNLFFKYNLNIVSIKVLYISPDGCGTIFNVYYFKLYLFKAINKSIFKLMMTMKAAFLFFTCPGQTKIWKFTSLFGLCNWMNQSNFELLSLENILINGHYPKNTKQRFGWKLLYLRI